MNEIQYLGQVTAYSGYISLFFAFLFLCFVYYRVQSLNSNFNQEEYKMEQDAIRLKERARVKEIKSLLDELEALDIAIQNERDMDTLFILWKQRTEAGIKIEILIK